MTRKSDYDLGNKVVQKNELIVGRWGMSVNI